MCPLYVPNFLDMSLFCPIMSISSGTQEYVFWTKVAPTSKQNVPQIQRKMYQRLKFFTQLKISPIFFRDENFAEDILIHFLSPFHRFSFSSNTVHYSCQYLKKLFRITYIITVIVYYREKNSRCFSVIYDSYRTALKLVPNDDFPTNQGLKF